MRGLVRISYDRLCPVWVCRSLLPSRSLICPSFIMASPKVRYFALKQDCTREYVCWLDHSSQLLAVGRIETWAAVKLARFHPALEAYCESLFYAQQAADINGARWKLPTPKIFYNRMDSWKDPSSLGLCLFCINLRMNSYTQTTCTWKTILTVPITICQNCALLTWI